MNIYNVDLTLQNTWYGVTIPRGLKNYLISAAGNNVIEVRRRGQNTVRAIPVSDTMEVLNRHLTEETYLEIRCPSGAGEIAEIVVW